MVAIVSPCSTILPDEDVAGEGFDERLVLRSQLAVHDLGGAVGHRAARGGLRRRRLEVVPVLNQLAVLHTPDVQGDERLRAEGLRILVRAVRDHEVALDEHAVDGGFQAGGLDVGEEAAPRGSRPASVWAGASANPAPPSTVLRAAGHGCWPRYTRETPFAAAVAAPP